MHTNITSSGFAKFIKNYTFIAFLCLFCGEIVAQTRVIYFKDKANSPFSLQRPQEFLTQKSIDRRTKQKIALNTRDLPVNQTYLKALTDAGARVLYATKWLNGCVVVCNDLQWNTINRLPFVNSGQQISQTMKIEYGEELQANQDINKKLFPLYAENQRVEGARTEGEENYGAALTQVKMLGIDEMHKANNTGKGINIAVFDAGFPSVDINKNSIYSRMSIVYTYDFVQLSPFVYGYSSHGANVLSVLAAYKPSETVGAAFEANYYLFRTENDDRLLDDRIEEFNWLAAAERADSLGVDIINSSLGYNYFKNPIYNYKQTDLNGKTAIISQAATLCARVGMLVVSSAGNIIEPEWTKIKMPADADSILAVASVNASEAWVSSSLQGNTTDNRVKPDVSAMGSGAVGMTTTGFVTSFNGTSYASPLIAGLAAGLWQANPQMTAMQVRQAIQRAGNRFFMPNTQLGYGIPTFQRAMSILSVADDFAEQNIMVFPNPLDSKSESLQVNFDVKLLQENCKVSLIDIAGREIFSTNLLIEQESITIPLKNVAISTGMYFLKLEGRKIKTVKKLAVF